MADFEAIIKLQTEGHDQVKKLGSQFKQLNKNVEKTQSKFAGLGKSAIKLGGALIAGLGLREIINQFGEMEGSLDRLKGALGGITTDVSGSVSEFRKLALELSRISDFTESQLVQIPGILAEAGVEAGDLAISMEAIAEFSRRSGEDIKTVAKAVAEGFGKGSFEPLSQIGIFGVTSRTQLQRILASTKLEATGDPFAGVMGQVKNVAAAVGRTIAVTLGPSLTLIGNFLNAATRAIQAFNRIIEASPLFKIAANTVVTAFGIAALITVLSKLVTVIGALAVSIRSGAIGRGLEGLGFGALGFGAGKTSTSTSVQVVSAAKLRKARATRVVAGSPPPTRAAAIAAARIRAADMVRKRTATVIPVKTSGLSGFLAALKKPTEALKKFGTILGTQIIPALLKWIPILIVIGVTLFSVDKALRRLWGYLEFILLAKLELFVYVLERFVGSIFPLKKAIQFIKEETVNLGEAISFSVEFWKHAINGGIWEAWGKAKAIIKLRKEEERLVKEHNDIQKRINRARGRIARIDEGFTRGRIGEGGRFIPGEPGVPGEVNLELQSAKNRMLGKPGFEAVNLGNELRRLDQRQEEIRKQTPELIRANEILRKTLDAYGRSSFALVPGQLTKKIAEVDTVMEKNNQTLRDNRDELTKNEKKIIDTTIALEENKIAKEEGQRALEIEFKLLKLSSQGKDAEVAALNRLTAAQDLYNRAYDLSLPEKRIIQIQDQVNAINKYLEAVDKLNQKQERTNSLYDLESKRFDNDKSFNSNYWTDLTNRKLENIEINREFFTSQLKLAQSMGNVDAILQYENALEDLNTKEKEVMQTQSEFTNIFNTEMTSAFSEIIRGTKSISQAFGDMVEEIIYQLTELVTQQAILAVVDKFLGPQGEGKGIGNFFGGLIKSMGVPSAASGGFVNAPVGMPVPAIIHGGETIIPAGSGMGIKIVNVLTESDVLSAVNSTNGERVIVNRVINNQRALRASSVGDMI